MELILISAADECSLIGQIERVVAFLDRVPDVSIQDVGYTCALTHGESVLAVLSENIQSLRARLSSALSRIRSGAVKIRDKSGTYYFREHLLGEGKGKLAFVYPGVMGFYPDMMRDLVVENPECRAAFDELEEALSGDESFTPSSFIFPPAPYYRHDADIFKSGAYAQALVATYTGCVAMTRVLRFCGIEPDGVVGFAGGDLAATVRSGAVGKSIDRQNRIKIISEIYSIVHKAVDHGGLPKVVMVTVLMRHPMEVDEIVRGFPADKVRLAVDFSPRQKTFAILEEFAQEAMTAFAKAGVRMIRLALDRPFNTEWCKPLVSAIRKFATGCMKYDPVVDIYSCATADKVPSGLKPARDDMGDRWAVPVRFEETILKMHSDGYRVFVEVGPRGLMSAAVSDTLRDRPHSVIALDSIHRRSILQTKHALGQLAALGAKLDISGMYARRGARVVDFDASILTETRKDVEMKLSRSFPKITLLSTDTILRGPSIFSKPSGRGARAAARASAIAQQARKQRQFDFGAVNPLISDADTLNHIPGVSLEITKTFRISEMPFIGDYALGTSQISYSDPNLRGLVLLSPTVGTEIMAEMASLLMPNRVFLRIEDLACRRKIEFRNGASKLFIKAERVSSGNASEVAVKVQIRDEIPNAEYTWASMEAVIITAEIMPGPSPISVPPLSRPRSVHWSGREIYPSRLFYGNRLRGIQFVEAWSESGIDYEIVVPHIDNNVAFTRFPLWVVNPLLMEIVVSGFRLWRSHEKFAGSFSIPFHLRRMSICGMIPNEGAVLNCYMRLAGVTPKSHICDITVTDGNGKELMTISGWEELIEHVPEEYHALLHQPALNFLTNSLGLESMGNPSTEVANAYITDVPYAIFERNEELWLKTMSHVVLDADERRIFSEMTGSASRRTEWLFGRIAAKEAVRRFLHEYYQARWSSADVRIWANDAGKPYALGAWSEFLSSKLDIAIAHTAQFVVAVAAASARVGVDVESANRDISEEFAIGVFTHEEMELVAKSVNPSQTVIKFWCAKEAVSKALGTGIRYSPKEMVVREFIPDTGTVLMRLEGAWENAFKIFKGRDIAVTVKLIRDHALATCFIPSSLFGDED